ncbi:MAG TPA: flagellar biosynthesis protein FlgB [Rhodobacteraceae bacterium]|nr:flagellar biosynthesis protein FlgB [Paracoccaceae bacterium]
MFENLKIFSMASALAQHGATRQTVVAENIANADTPGYRARDVASFADSYASRPTTGLQATRPGHRFDGEASYSAAPREIFRPGAESPNGNNVSIENEIFAAAEASSDHRKALAVYRSALTVLRTSISGQS